MIKITDYLVYVKDKKQFQKIADRVNKKFNLKHQNAFGDLYGSVTGSYDKERHDTKSIISVISIYEVQKEGMDYLIEQANKNKDIYQFIDRDVAKELYEKYPRILEAKGKFDWGFEVKRWYDYPKDREVDYNLCEIRCDDCYEEFVVCGVEHEMDGEKIQCPHCRVELELELECVPALNSRKIS